MKIKPPLTLVDRIRVALGTHTLHVQQIVEALIPAGTKSRVSLEIDVRSALSDHSGRGLALFLRVAHGFYRNRKPGDRRKLPGVQRMVSGKLAQLVYDAVGSRTVNANEAVAYVATAGGVPKTRCDRPHISAVLYNNCSKGLRCFERVSPGRYRTIPGRRPSVDPTGRHCAAKEDLP